MIIYRIFMKGMRASKLSIAGDIWMRMEISLFHQFMHWMRRRLAAKGTILKMTLPNWFCRMETPFISIMQEKRLLRTVTD